MDPYDLLNDSVVRIDANGIIRSWNQASGHLYGLPSATVTGRSLCAVFGDGEESWRDRLSCSDSWEGEAVRNTAAGTQLIQLRWAIRRNDDGTIAEIFETGRSAEELHELRSMVQESRFRYENLFQALAVAFFETDFRAVGVELRRLLSTGVTDLRAYLLANPDYTRSLMNIENIIDANPTAVKLFAAGSAEDLKGSRSSRLWPDESLVDYVNALAAVLERQPHYVCETRLRALDGTTIDALFTVGWSPESAARGIMIVGVIDLGDRNRAFEELQRREAKHRGLLDAMSVGYLEYDFARADVLLERYREAGVQDLSAHLLADPSRIIEMLDAIDIVGINDQALKIFAVDHADQMPHGVRWLWPTDGFPVLARTIDGRFRKQAAPSVEVRLRRIDGSEICAEFTVWTDPRRRAGDPVLCAVVDISDRVAAQQRLERVQNEFAHASRLFTVGELAATIAHEISQPLSAIITNTVISQRTLEQATISRGDTLLSLNQHTRAAAQRANAIVARIRSMVLAVAPQHRLLSINDVVVEALQFVRHELKHADVRQSLHLEDGLPLVSGDKIQVQQIVVNLIINALQAMKQTSSNRRLVISTRIISKDHNDDMIHLSVEDTGPGFPAGHEERIFDSFYTTKTAGMGIGLAVCRSIAEHHGGSVEAHLLPTGACFDVLLPTARSAPKRTDEQDTA